MTKVLIEQPWLHRLKKEFKTEMREKKKGDMMRHNCFNPLSLFELCFPIDWRLLVDWDIYNNG